MIPKILHYCWIGGAEMPELAKECIASWKKHMPDWEYKRWDESNFDIAAAPLYVRQAYDARKFAFVSDYVRLWALEKFGGLYMDVDFMVYRPFDELMDKYAAFAGYEGSKRKPVMQGVIASEPRGAWVRDMLSTYENRTFYKSPLTGNPSPVTPEYDLTPNTSYFTDRLEAQGFIADGVEKDFYIEGETKTKINTAFADININKEEIKNEESAVTCSNQQSTVPYSAHEQAPGQTNDQLLATDTNEMYLQDSSKKNDSILESQKNTKNGHADRMFMLHVFPVHYFCPVLTTGEDVRTEETYCEHMGESSWAKQTWKAKMLGMVSPKMRTKLIKLKRKILG